MTYKIFLKDSPYQPLYVRAANVRIDDDAKECVFTDKNGDVTAWFSLYALAGTVRTNAAAKPKK